MDGSRTLGDACKAAQPLLYQNGHPQLIVFFLLFPATFISKNAKLSAENVPAQFQQYQLSE